MTTIQDKLWQYIQEISDQKSLNELLELAEKMMKKKEKEEKGNMDKVLSHAGFLSDEEADEMRKLIEDEFSKIDGDW